MWGGKGRKTQGQIMAVSRLKLALDQSIWQSNEGTEFSGIVSIRFNLYYSAPYTISLSEGGSKNSMIWPTI